MVKKRSSLFTSIVVFCTLLTMLVLGFSQLYSFHQKKNLVTRFKRHAFEAPYQWEVFLNLSQKEFHRVVVTGQFINNQTLLLQNQRHANQLGVDILTPFSVKGDNKVLLVNRGWVSNLTLQKNVVSVRPIEGEQTIEGYVYFPLAHGVVIGENIKKNNFGLHEVKQVDTKELATYFKEPFYPYELRLSSGAAGGYLRQWKIFSVEPARHVFCAIQWFVMALALLMLYLFYLSKKSRKKKIDE